MINAIIIATIVCIYIVIALLIGISKRGPFMKIIKPVKIISYAILFILSSLGLFVLLSVALSFCFHEEEDKTIAIDFLAKTYYGEYTGLLYEWKTVPSDWDGFQKLMTDMAVKIRERSAKPFEDELKVEYQKKFGEPISDFELSMRSGFSLAAMRSKETLTICG